MAHEVVRSADLVTARYEEMLGAFDVVMGENTRKSAVPSIRALPQLLPEGEELIAFTQARLVEPRAKVVVAATTSRLLVIKETPSEVLFDLSRSDAKKTEFAKDLMWGSRLTVQSDDWTLTFKQVLPGAQADRLFVLLGGEDPRPNRLDLLTPGQSTDPGHPPLAAMWEIAVYEDRIIDQMGRHLPFGDGPVEATADTAGNIAVTRGRNLAAKGVGTLLLGPIGLFGVGNAKERQTDTRELYLLIEGPGWAYTQQFKPELGGPIRQFAQTIQQIARQHVDRRKPEPDEEAKAVNGDPITAIRELAALRDDGILTDEEFQIQKARLLKEI